MKSIIFILILLISPLLAESEIKSIYALIYGKSTYPSELLNVKDATKDKLFCGYFILFEQIKELF